MELREEFIKFLNCFRKMFDVNDDYRIGLEVDIKIEDKEVGFDEQ